MQNLLAALDFLRVDRYTHMAKLRDYFYNLDANASSNDHVHCDRRTGSVCVIGFVTTLYQPYSYSLLASQLTHVAFCLVYSAVLCGLLLDPDRTLRLFKLLVGLTWLA